jgi:hypothetical protein
MMDDTTPTPDSETDEVMSASIDGELRPTEHDPVDERAARRAELVAARDALRDAPVAPLDDLTRRRLVSRALEESAAPVRRGWTDRVPWRAVAAVLAVVVVAGGVALSLQVGGSSSSSTASRTKSAANARDRGAQTTAAAPDLSATAALGDLGDVSDPKGLAQRVHADQFGAAKGASGTQSSAPTPSATEVLGSCASALRGLGTIRAVGSGTVDGRAAAIAVITDGQGHAQAVVVLLDGCRARPPVSL